MRFKSLGFVDIDEKKYNFLRHWRNQTGYARVLIPVSDRSKIIRIYPREVGSTVEWYNGTESKIMATNIYSDLNKLDKVGLYSELKNYVRRLVHMQCGAGILRQEEAHTAAENYMKLDMAELQKKRVAAHRLLKQRRQERIAAKKKPK